MKRRVLWLGTLAGAFVALRCSLMVSPGDFVSGGPRDAGPPDADPGSLDGGGRETGGGSANRLFVVAGERPKLGTWDDVPTTSEAFSAPIDESGHVGAWRVEKTPPYRGYYSIPALRGDTLFVFGYGMDLFGNDGFGMEWITLKNPTTSDWKAAPALDNVISDPGVVVTSNSVLLLGGSRYFDDDAGKRTLWYDEVWSAPFDANAKTVGAPSMSATKLVTKRGRVGSIARGDFVYTVGGYDSNAGVLADCEFARLDGAGLPGAFQSTASLKNAQGQPYKVIEPILVTSGDMIYVIGGRLDTNGTPSDLVLGSKVAPDGSLADWQVLAKLPTPLKSMGATAHDGVLYAIAGEGVTAYSDLVHSAKIKPDGTLDTWETTPNAKLPVIRSDLAVVAY